MAKVEPSAVGRLVMESDIEHCARRPGQTGLVTVAANRQFAGMRQNRKERFPEPGQLGRAENVRVPETGLLGRDRAAELFAVAGDARDRGERLSDRHSAVGGHEP